MPTTRRKHCVVYFTHVFRLSRFIVVLPVSFPSIMAEIKYYTLAEVATHKTNNDVWMVIHNTVYDVTAFLNEV